MQVRLVLAAIFGIFSCSLIVLSTAESHHLIVGFQGVNDQLLQREHVKFETKWTDLSNVLVNKETRTFSGDGRSIITSVRALDQKTNGNGATASVINGGPGSNFVTLKFESKRGHGIDFIVEIWGRPQ